jgi:hypothetical protein
MMLMVGEWNMSTEHWQNALSVTSYHARIGMMDDELEMFCNLSRNVEPTYQGSGHTKSGEHKCCT